MLDDPQNQAKFQAILDTAGDGREAFFLDPLARLKEAGIPIIPAASVPHDAQALFQAHGMHHHIAPGVSAMAAQATATTEHIDVRVEWWGITFVMNERMTHDILVGTAATAPLGGAIASALAAAGVVTGGIATAIGMGIATIVGLKVAQIKITDAGNGVNWPVSWPQWALLAAAAASGGPVGVSAAGMALLHPLRN